MSGARGDNIRNALLLGKEKITGGKRCLHRDVAIKREGEMRENQRPKEIKQTTRHGNLSLLSQQRYYNLNKLIFLIDEGALHLETLSENCSEIGKISSSP